MDLVLLPQNKANIYIGTNGPLWPVLGVSREINHSNATKNPGQYSWSFGTFSPLESSNDTS